MTQVGQDFETATGVPVAVHQLGFGDIRDQLQLRGPAGEGPDVIIGAHDWLGQLVENGLVEPLDLGTKTDSFDPVALEAFTYDGQLYGVPYASEAIALYYNTDLVPEPPTTWDELKQIAQQLQDDGTVEQGYVLQTGPADPYHSYPILTGHGGYIFARDEAGQYDPSDVGLDSEGGLAYARELDQMIKDGILRQDVNYDTMISLFTSGSSAMFMSGPWALGPIRESGVPFDVAPIPAMAEEARPFVGVQAFMVSAFAPNKTLAETFLTEYIATDETMAALFEVDPRPPTWLAQVEQVDDEQVLAFVESASTGDPMPAIPEMSAVWTDWIDALNLIFTQAQDPEQAMRDAADSIRATIGGSASPSP
jgi:maltose/maltodextrin transport system substrate-binding protein/arabinogalactan oligomer/maltooligosaccharide transport system substrate-binding protein